MEYADAWLYIDRSMISLKDELLFNRMFTSEGRAKIKQDKKRKRVVADNFLSVFIVMSSIIDLMWDENYNHYAKQHNLKTGGKEKAGSIFIEPAL
jgi:hypothetical protein